MTIASSSTPTTAPAHLLMDLHTQYIVSLDQQESSLAYHLTEHLRLNGVYWGLVALCIMGNKDALDKEAMVDYVVRCWDKETGGFGSHPGHDAHLLSTLSAVQILAIHSSLDRLPRARIIAYILGLRPKGKGYFTGDAWGEVDTRFTYCAVSALSLLGALGELDKVEEVEGDEGEAVTVREKVVRWYEACRNFDGGFGSQEGAESHAGQVFASVAALAILDRLDIVDADQLGWWLSERQLKNGGLNGRPEKLEDVCYSWWVLSAISILKKLHWINAEKLIGFILSAQDPDAGGIADRPGDVADVFHTLFGIAALSLLGYENLRPVDPVYCMPAEVIEGLGLKKDCQTLTRKVDGDGKGQAEQ